MYWSMCRIGALFSNLFAPVLSFTLACVTAALQLWLSFCGSILLLEVYFVYMLVLLLSFSRFST